MAYNRVNWEDAPSTKTPVSAENLNKMDAGIFANDKKLRKAISIKQEVDDSAENIDSTLIESLPAATSAEDTDIMILENATKTQKITWGTILNLIKAKLGIGTAANLQTTSKEIVGAVNELNSNLENILTTKTGIVSKSSLIADGVFNLRSFGKIVNLNFTFRNSDTINANDTMFTLPEGFRPNNNGYTYFMMRINNSNVVYARITDSGTVYCPYDNIPTGWSCGQATFIKL